ncbi:E3 ubiquitin-protein ligase E3D [Phytophthora nicotianae]|uniref:E3 ubiquitin-protein ligase E3D n=1 Tax=Phytophthora nicotianae TaxID=4792 RepID=A0A0W8C4R3_PHYNI|nr:E3 ubiquitin-protein ligase E3D [Phytophthora nicotianae]
METEAKALLEELRAAQEEHERALVAANQVRNTLDRARKEYEEARAAEKASEDELAKAAEALACGLQNLEVDSDTAELNATVPPTVDSLVEYHANIGCYQCYLFLDRHIQSNKQEGTFDVAKLLVRVEFPRVELTFQSQGDKEDVLVIWWTEIERNVDVSQCVLEDKDDHWYLRLPIRPSDKQPLGGFSSFTQVSNIELQSDSYTSVCCRNCNAQLLGTTRIEKVLPLPSANWMDMFDFWGAGIGAFEHIPRDDIHAQKHRVLVGESYVLLHASDFLTDATVGVCEDAAVESKEEREWMPLTCAACSERVGLSNVEQPDTIRLHKHLVIAGKHLKSSIDDDNVFAKYTIDSILSAKLLEMADADGKFRFILTSSDDHDHEFQKCSHSPATGDGSELLLQLLSWETMIKQQDATKFRRVLKVLYGPPQSMPAIPGLLPSQEVALPPAMYSAIAKRLETSSTLLPSSLRTFNRMNVGYLFA